MPGLKEPISCLVGQFQDRQSIECPAGQAFYRIPRQSIECQAGQGFYRIPRHSINSIGIL